MGVALRYVLLAVGYGCYQAASSAGYLSAMGTVDVNLGFVSQLPYMMAKCVFEAIAFIVVAILAKRGTLGPQSIPTPVGYVLLGLAVVVGTTLFDGNSGLSTYAPVVLGALHGTGGALVSLVWFEAIVLYAQDNCLPVFLGSFATSALIGLTLASLTGAGGSALLLVWLLVSSLACMLALRRGAHYGDDVVRARPPYQNLALASDDGRDFVAAWLCMLVCHFVVGIANTAVFSSSFSSMLAGVNVNACVLAACLVVGVAFVVTREVPQPERVFKLAMPLLLVVFSLMALVADALGPLAAYVMIGAYEAIALVYSAFITRFMHDGNYSPYHLVGLTAGVSSITLLLGMSIGIGLNVLSDAQGVPLLTLLAFIAIYPLGLAFLYIQRSHALKEKSVVQKQADLMVEQAQAQIESLAKAKPEDLFADKMVAFSKRNGLTKRESEVCAHLVRGHTVKHVANELSISENTAWTHIRSVYSKCMVGTKQELIETFDRLDEDASES